MPMDDLKPGQTSQQLESEPIARLLWQDLATGRVMEYLLLEGATATIGRSRSNDICIPERHVSRRHAVVRFQDGVFMIEDLGSANGTFVNDKQVLEPYPLMAGDVIRLFVPELQFAAYSGFHHVDRPLTTSMVITPTQIGGRPYLVVTSGPQEGTEFRLLKKRMMVGRATAHATWDISLQDRAVSRPHCCLDRLDDDSGWTVTDLRSSNGTRVNGRMIQPEQPRRLNDGDVLAIGATTLLFRAG
ncbi:MAG: hypothetical protein Kow0077_08310 [Anaerolineae bacterium]